MSNKWGFPSGSVQKNLPAQQGIRSLGQEDPLEKEVETHSGILGWEVPWTESLADQSPWDHKESDTVWQVNSSSSMLNKH